MVAATTRISWYGASPTEPASIDAEDNAGITFTREDSKSGNPVTSAIPIPLVSGTVFSWPKLVALEVMAVGTTTIANRRISPSGPMPTGVHWYVKGLAVYDQPGVSNMPADHAANAHVPAGYTEATQTVPVVYDATAIVSTSLGRNGNFASMVLGIDELYGAAAGISGTIPLPTYRLSYDEA